MDFQAEILCHGIATLLVCPHSLLVQHENAPAGFRVEVQPARQDQLGVALHGRVHAGGDSAAVPAALGSLIGETVGYPSTSERYNLQSINFFLLATYYVVDASNHLP